MDTGLQDSLRNLYRQGVDRGYRQGRIDRGFYRIAFAAGGWFIGVFCGLVMTGWL